MITFIVLINTERGKVNTIAESLVNIPQISEVFSVTGNYDLVAIARAKTNDDIASLVTEQLADIQGIAKTDTMLAFKAYSKQDLESMFAI